ncbi:GNAT family N-acetyltransferase [Streptomyces indicus]|uniref:Diamine N-acetyltransferase n=1 Tax=Streptomyces indicus TaxID=417292 RepID=A0A1G8Z1T7_9ACTN|nr:GNAT family N-acetyltransferase [Streptomyces indicus]SDK09038.1 diamine N-acetyltransferase [Streptomyces indicus]
MISENLRDATGRRVTLHEVTADTWRSVADMAPHVSQRAFAPALAARYLLLSLLEDTWTSLAVHADDTVVGHVMWARDQDGSHWIGGLLIDASEQGKGLARTTMRTLLPWLAAQPGHFTTRLSYAPANTAAAALYESLGFRPTGTVEEGEVVAALSPNEHLSRGEHLSPDEHLSPAGA